MPAQAGIQTHLNSLGSRLRGNDESEIFQTFLNLLRLEFDGILWRGQQRKNKEDECRNRSYGYWAPAARSHRGTIPSSEGMWQPRAPRISSTLFRSCAKLRISARSSMPRSIVQ